MQIIEPTRASWNLTSSDKNSTTLEFVKGESAEFSYLTAKNSIESFVPLQGVYPEDILIIEYERNFDCADFSLSQDTEKRFTIKARSDHDDKTTTRTSLPLSDHHITPSGVKLSFSLSNEQSNANLNRVNIYRYVIISQHIWTWGVFILAPLTFLIIMFNVASTRGVLSGISGLLGAEILISMTRYNAPYDVSSINTTLKTFDVMLLLYGTPFPMQIPITLLLVGLWCCPLILYQLHAHSMSTKSFCVLCGILILPTIQVLTSNEYLEIAVAAVGGIISLVLLYSWFLTLGKVLQPLLTFKSIAELIQRSQKKISIVLLLLLLAQGFGILWYELYLRSGEPFFIDSQLYLKYASALSKGEFIVAATSPSNPSNDSLIAYTGAGWIPLIPPGYLLILTAFVFLHLQLYLGPLLAIANSFVIFHIAKKLFSNSTALLAVLLAVISPFTFQMHGEYMTHSLSHLCFLLLVHYWLNLKNTHRAQVILSGLILGLGIITRPFTLFAQLLPFLSETKRLLSACQNSKRLAWWFFAPAIVMASIYPLYNYFYFGNPFISAYQSVYGSSHLPGFGAALHGGTHTLWDGITRVWKSVLVLDHCLFGWPIPSTLLCIAFFLSRSLRRVESILALSVCSLIVLHGLHSGPNIQLGPRFIFETTGILFIFTAEMIRDLTKSMFITNKDGGGLALMAIYITIVVCSFTSYYPTFLSWYQIK